MPGDERRGAAREWIAVAALFFLSAAARFLLADFPRRILTYPDETLYFTIAQSLAEGRGLSVYGLPTSFQKVLYSLALVPAFLVSDRFLRLRLIALINAALMSSGVVPAYLLGRRHVKRGWKRIALCLLYVACSDMAYTMTFMSEALFLPFSLWVVLAYDALLSFEGSAGRRRALCAAVGALTYLLYLNKETSVALPAAFALVTLWEARGDARALRARLCDVAALLGAFLALFAAMKLTAFAGRGEFYDQSSAAILLEPGHAAYMVYGFLQFLLGVAAAYGMLPVAMPLLFPGTLDARTRRLHRFVLCAVVLTAAGVAYTITIREDFGAPAPRVHMRYICYAFLPLAVALCHQSESGAQVSRKNLVRALLLTAAGTLIYMAFWSGGGYDPSTIDNTMLKFAEGLTRKRLLFLCAAAGCCMLLLALAFGRRRAVFLPLFLLPLLGVQAFNNWVAVNQYRFNHSLSERGRAELIELSERMLPRDEGETLLVMTAGIDGARTAFDVYLERRDTYSVSLWDFLNIQGSQSVDLTVAALPRFFFGGVYRLDAVDWLLLPSDYYLSDDTLSPVWKGTRDGYPYSLYAMNDATSLPVLHRWWEIADGENIFPLTAEHFSSRFPLKDGAFVSGEGENYLLYGPYESLPPGEYEFTLSYRYAGDLPDGAPLGTADIAAEHMDLSALQREFYAGEDSVTIGVSLPNGCMRLETRLFTTAPGVEATELKVVKK